MTATKDLFPSLTKITLKEVHTTSPETQDSFDRALDVIVNAAFPQRFSNDFAVNFQKHYDQNTGALSVDFFEEMVEEMAPEHFESCKECSLSNKFS